jgi:CrcB protein
VTSTPSRLFVVVALGGAGGGLLRWSCGELVADGAGFPATTFAINVVGSFLLALLPAFAVVRRHRALAAALGPGLLGGFTTLSAASEQTRALLAAGDLLTAGVYVVGTLVACLCAVTVSSQVAGRSFDRAAR